MISRMEPWDIKHGYLYAVSAMKDVPFSIEPYLAIETSSGIRFVHGLMLDIDPSMDGPHDVSEEATNFATRHGWDLHHDDIWSFWSEREEIQQVLTALNTGKLRSHVDHPVVLEAQRILQEVSTPSGEASTWLRHSEHWAGSSMSALYSQDGSLAGAFVTVYAANQYKLRSLLRWLGVPREIVARVTGLER